jgi:hypothetical protein
MHSSISVSNEGNTAQALKVLLAALLLYCCVLEVVAQAGFPRLSRIQRRIASGKRDALALQPTSAEGAKTVLLLGNSLVVHGVDTQLLHKEMAPRLQSNVFAIENTQYLDWYFGLRRLFAEGSHPGVVALCLSTRQLISKGTDGEYFAHYIMQGRDLLSVRKEAKLDVTTTSNFFFASHSAWLGSRASIRNWLLGELMPNVEQLTAYLPQQVSAMPSGDVVVGEGMRRLQTLEALCASHGTRFVLVIPPSMRPGDRSDELQAAAESVGIRVVIPYRAAEMPASYFEDGFHLNSQGAVAFTEKLALALLEEEPRN